MYLCKTVLINSYQSIDLNDYVSKIVDSSMKKLKHVYLPFF